MLPFTAWAQVENPSAYASEKEQMYLDMGFIIYPPKQPRHSDPEFQKQQQAEIAAKAELLKSQNELAQAIQARVDAEKLVEQLRKERVALEDQHEFMLRQERGARMIAESNAQQFMKDKERAESELISKIALEQQAKTKLQQEIQNLIEQKNRFNEIKNQISLLTNELDRDKKNYDRFKLLNDDNKNVSDKALQEVKVNYENTRIKLNATQELVSGIKQNIRAQWGETILSMIDQGLKKELFEFLLQDKARIVKVTLSENTDNEPPKNISLALIDNLSEKFLANYLAESPTLDKSLKGKTYFYIVYNCFLIYFMFKYQFLHIKNIVLYYV